MRRVDCSSSVTRRRSVMSRTTAANPRRLPLSSNTGVISECAQKVVPSLRRRHPSSTTRPSLKALSRSCEGRAASTSTGV